MQLIIYLATSATCFLTDEAGSSNMEAVLVALIAAAILALALLALGVST